MTQEKIGRYIILAELGRGGMATVYRAKDPNFDRNVAVKVLPRTFLHDPQFRVRFEREAKTIAALEHTAIVPVYDFGEENGQPYIVMRLMSGGTLADKLDKGKLPIEEAARIITQISPGLFTAHTQGIIHRDLKPGNILFDQYDNAYLSDFGIARFAEGDSTLTGSRILGTPAYMSPEQIQGDKSLDHRSDIYAMGVLFYQMLVGDTPFQATTPAKVMMMHIMEPVPNILSSLPTVPNSVKIWLERVLAKDPDDRFSDANEMSIALQAAMQGKAPPPLTKTVVAPNWSEETTQQGPVIVSKYPAKADIQQATGKQVDSSTYGEPNVATFPPAEIKRKGRLSPWVIAIIILLGIGVITTIGAVFLGTDGKGPLAFLAQSTPTETIEPAAVEPSTDTPQPTLTQPETDTSATENTSPPTFTVIPPTATKPTSSPTIEPKEEPGILVIGGADKIAFLDGNEIFLMNVDGSELEQLTNDRAEKTNLNWFPDGSAITYISGKCIWYLEIESTRTDAIACFESAEYLENFTFSPDGTQVAISVNRKLYVVPWDLNQLQSVGRADQLAAMSECPSLAPFASEGSSGNIKQMIWSDDGQTLLALEIGAFQGLQADILKIFRFINCNTPPDRTDEIPGVRFKFENYEKNPIIDSFGYDNDSLIAMIGIVRDINGFGHLYIYNTNNRKVEARVNPIDGECCYRDPKFSPDGRYLIFVYQPFEPDAQSYLYYVPYGTIGTGANYEPIPIPESFFNNPRGKPQPVLRPAQ